MEAAPRRAPPVRCPWVTGDPLYIAYHDLEWGVPSRDDRHLFEMLILEGAQAGLSWYTILRKREGYRRAFAGFDPGAVAAFDDARLEALSRDPGIVRNRRKIAAARDTARAVLRIQEEAGSLAAFLWGFVDGEPIVNRWRTLDEVPTETGRSRELSRALRARGCRFVGPIICYAFMQAVGMVNDHLVSCFRSPHARPGREGEGEGRARQPAEERMTDGGRQQASPAVSGTSDE